MFGGSKFGGSTFGAGSSLRVGEAALSATATVTSDAIKILIGAASLSGSATVSASALRIATATASILATATLEAVISFHIITKGAATTYTLLGEEDTMYTQVSVCQPTEYTKE